MKVLDLFKVRPQAGDIGIEIEVEGYNFEGAEGWKVVLDHSLGRGVEYVLGIPCKIWEVDDFLSYVEEAVEKGDRVQSVRAGVHVHINVQELNVVQLYTFITAYLCYEDALVKWCGPEREGNLFCLRARDAEFLLDFIIKSIKTGKMDKHLNHDDLRYASINLKSIFTYGSLEFRAMRSDGDFDGLSRWIKMLYALKTNSIKFANPAELINGLSEMSIPNLTDSLFGDMADEVKCVPDYTNLVIDCVRGSAQDIAFCVNWEEHFKRKATLNPFQIAGGLANEGRVWL